MYQENRCTKTGRRRCFHKALTRPSINAFVRITHFTAVPVMFTRPLDMVTLPLLKVQKSELGQAGKGVKQDLEVAVAAIRTLL